MLECQGMKSVAIFVAPGFEEIEFAAPLDILRRLNVRAVTVGVDGNEIAGAHGLIVKTDSSLDAFKLDDFDGIILPGGGGAWVLRDNPQILDIIKAACSSGKLVAAICAAPMALSRAGVAKGKNITAYPMQEVYDELKDSTITEMPVTLDGNLLTAYGPGAAMAFGYAIGEYLGLASEVVGLKKGMMYTE